MAKQVLNILIGMNASRRSDAFIPGFRKMLEKHDEIIIDRIDMVSERKSIDKAVEGGNYDVLICQDSLANENIGIGSINSWRQAYPDMHIILVVQNNRKGGDKLYKLYSRNYYDAMYLSDFANGDTLVSAILNSRSEQAAFVYYGVENNADYQREQEELRLKQEQTIQEAHIEEDDANNKEERTDSGVVEDEETASYAEAFRTFEEEHEESKEAIATNDSMKQTLISDMDELFGADEKVPYAEKERGEVKEKVMQEERPLEDKVRQAGILKDRENKKTESKDMTEEKKENYSLIERIDESAVLVTTRIDHASVVPHEGYVVSAISDTALIIEVPGEHFLDLKKVLPNLPITLITPRLPDKLL